MEQPPLALDALDALDALHGVPKGVLELLPYLNANQRAYLIARPMVPSRTQAANLVGVSEGTVYSWRSAVPGFREAEAAVVDAVGDASLQLARALYKGAMPSVAQKQITQALEDHTKLHGQQLMAQQRAREAVAKGAGLEATEAPRDAVLDFIAELRALQQAARTPDASVAPQHPALALLPSQQQP